ncbi:MAG: tetratricopeptide repeat protein [Pyrinomonadaceae bacterium]
MPQGIVGQGGGESTLFGDFKIDESQVSGIKPISFHIILYTASGTIVRRQSVTNNGRYRFMNLRNGEYYLVVEMENSEVARINVMLSSPGKNDIRQDILLEWRADSGGKKRDKVVNVVAADHYERALTHKKEFENAAEAIDKQNYDQAVLLLRRITSDDPKDFQAWTELGTAYLLQQNAAEAEKAYLRAIEERPVFVLALINLGRLRIMKKNYEGAIEPLSRAVKISPGSANANYFLGEAFLLMKKGSKAVGYFSEALRLDPIGMANAHLRLAALYNGAGIKEKAAVEYQEFLKKQPNYADKRKLEQYINQNRKQ